MARRCYHACGFKDGEEITVFDYPCKKTLFCLAVNLLELDDLRRVMGQIKEEEECLSVKEKAVRMAGLLQEAAAQKAICLKLRKKPAKEKEM